MPSSSVSAVLHGQRRQCGRQRKPLERNDTCHEFRGRGFFHQTQTGKHTNDQSYHGSELGVDAYCGNDNSNGTVFRNGFRFSGSCNYDSAERVLVSKGACDEHWYDRR